MVMPAEKAGSAADEILNLMRVYFDGLYFSDVDRLQSIFHAQAIYVCATEQFVCLTLPEYLSLVKNRPSPFSANQPREDYLLSVEFSGRTAAHVRAQCRIGKKVFNDLLSLVYCDGCWKIMSKVFHFEFQ